MKKYASEELEEKAEEYIKKHMVECVQEQIEYFSFAKQSYIAGAKENGIIWHDLRKDPNDLPSSNTNVLVKTNSITECAVFHRRLDGAYFWSCSFEPIERHPKIVIAWCELPKFEVEE